MNVVSQAREVTGSDAWASGSFWKRALRRLQAPMLALAQLFQRPFPTRRLLVPSLFYFIFFLWLFDEVFLASPAAGRPRVFFGWDALNHFWPDFAYRFASVWNGEWPMWNPYDLGGMPHAARSQTMLFYPPSWLLVVFALPNGELSVWSVQYFLLGHFVLGAVGVHVLARHMRVLEPLCYVAGLTAMMAAPVLTHRNSSFFFPLIWLPLLVVVLDKLLLTPNRKTALTAAVLCILAGSAANPPGVFNLVLGGVLFLLPMLVVTLIQTGRAAPNKWRGILRRLGAIGLCGSVAVAIAGAYLAVTYLPQASLLTETDVPVGEKNYVLNRALSFAHLPSLLNCHWPQTWWFDVFVGILTLLVIPVALFVKPDRLSWVLVLAGIVSVWLAIGDEGGGLLLAAEHIPLFGINRKAYRYAAVFAFFAAPVAARGLSILVEVAQCRSATMKLQPAVSWCRRPENRSTLGTVVTIAAAGLTLGVVSPGLPANAEDTTVLASRLLPWELLITCLLLTGAVLVPRSARRWRTPVVWACVSLAVLMHIWHMHWSGKDRFALVEPLRTENEAALFDWAKDTDVAWRLWPDRDSHTGAANRYLRRMAGGYEVPEQLKRHKQFMEWAARKYSRFGLFNVRYMSTRHPGLTSFAEHEGGHRYQNMQAVPLLAAYHAVEKVPDGDALLHWERAEQAGRVVVEESDWIADLEAMRGGAGPRSSGQVTHYAANRIEGTISSTGAALVVLNEVYYKGWRVEVDGAPAPLVRVNHLLRGVAVGPGDHKLTYSFVIPHYPELLSLFFLSLLALVGLAVAPRVRERWRRV